jgi:hypothetical protein
MMRAEAFGHELAWRRVLPVMLIPLGALYCQLFDVAFGKGSWDPTGSLAWAAATLTPWVAAALLFEHAAQPADTRPRLLRRAIVLAGTAYLVSGLAALAIGGDNFHAFYSRIPLAAAALLAAALYSVPASVRDAVPISDDGGRPPVTPTEIAFASAAGNYVELHFGGRSTVWRQTMQNAERILAPAGFVRIHRSFLVPVRGIETVARGRKGPVAVALRDGRRLPVSHSYAANLRGWSGLATRLPSRVAAEPAPISG